jgi:hypothetical protein
MLGVVPISVRVVSGFDLPAWLTAIGTVILAAGVLLAARQLREARIARLAEAAGDISRRWDEDELIDARAEVDKYGSDVELRDAVVRGMRGEDDNVNLDLLFREAGFFDDLGLQEILGGISLQWIEFSTGRIVVDRWELWSLAVDEVRKLDPEPPPAYGNFESLANQLRGNNLGQAKRIRRRISLWLIRNLPY